MNIGNHVKAFIITVATALAGQSAQAQDLLARQAPIDRKARIVDTLMLQRIIEEEMEASIAADLYANWNNTGVHNRNALLPEQYKIDLRDFTMPTPSRVITSNYGPRWGRRHEGLDIKVYTGDTIRSAFSGRVRIVKFDRKGYGNYVVVRHPNGLETVYGHLSRQLVREGQDLKSGDVIGLGGSTGRSSGSHLHFETLLNGIPINPALLFDFRMQDVTGDFYTYNRATYADEDREATRLRGKMGNGGYTPEMVRGDAAPAFNPAKETARSSSSVKKYHKVKKGETLSSIARKRHTTVDRLCRLNGIKKSAKLRPNQILRYS
ncbi:MAG: peptidoglycan DD-metalloendopeptidase family protein [Prevotella sp.]|nr:peptidoglycan DD-metalloendopeptidase family protein [Prevotella sp.]